MSQCNPQSRSLSVPKASEPCRIAPFVVWEEERRYALCFYEGAHGWVPLRTSGRHIDPGTRIQIGCCIATGEVWAKPLVGRYRHRDEEDLQDRLTLLREVTMRLGSSSPRETGPLWMQVEELENTLEFDLRPPCGCPPHRALRAPWGSTSGRNPGEALLSVGSLGPVQE